MLGDLSRQDLPAAEFEVVLVDDGSKTPARAVVEANTWPFALRIFEQPNSGQAAARDRAVRAAEGRVVVVIDDDMELPTHFLSAHLTQHEAGFEVVLGHIRASPELRTRPLFERFHAKFTDGMIDTARRGEPIRGAWLCTGNVSFRRDAYLAVGGFDRALARSEDRDLGIRFEARGERITFAEEAYTTHHSDHDSLDLWLRRARLYGIYDSRIAKKHAALAYVDPWRFLFDVNPLSRPLLVLAVVAPTLGGYVSKAAMKTSEALDARGLEGPAIRGTTLVYGLEYFLGVRSEAGSLRESARGLARYVKKALAPSSTRKSGAHG